MLYVFYGSDFKTKNQSIKKFVDSLGGEVNFKFSGDDFNLASIQELAEGQGLFSPNYVVVFENVLSQKEAKETLLESLERLNNSKNTFILSEDFLGKRELDRLKTSAKTIKEFVEKEKTEDKIFQNPQIFSLTDSFGKKDKKSAWINLHKATPGALPEEITNILFWQIKAIALSMAHKTAGASGLKPFVFNKALSFSRNFSKPEIDRISSKIISLYHDAHRGRLDMATGLEKLILEVL